MSIFAERFNGYNVADTVTISPHDTTLIVNDTTNNPNGYELVWLYVMVAGNAVVLDINSNVRTLTGLPVGAIVPFPVRRVNSTGTTASLLGLVCKG